MLAYTFGVGSHGQTRIATVWTDGSHKRVLTSGGAAYDPAWSPDGSQLAYSTYRGIALMTATGAGQHLVVPDGQHPAWAPDGHRLSYACEDGLCVHDLTTGQSSVVVPATEDWPAVESSSWSPDGSSIAFTRISADGDDYTSDTQVWTVHADGTGPAGVPGTAPEGIEPLWSPDGTSIMYTEHYGGRGGEYSGDVWLVHPDGTARTSVLALLGSEFGSSWAPDGSRVVVSSAADLYPTMDGIWTLRPDGTDRRLVVREGWGASWRPGFDVPLPGTTGARPRPGPRVAYVAMTDTGFDLFTARPDGAGVRQLTTTGKVAAPEWSPDHHTLAFTVRSRRNGYSLWTVRADGHGLRRVTGVGYRPTELAWAPDGRAVAYGDGPHLCVYTLASRARKCRRISDNDVETVSHPSFAPGGDVLVFSLTDNTEVSHLMVVGARKGPVRRLTRLRGSELDPSWSPRGDSIAFTLALGDQFDRRGRTTVMTVRADGSHPRVLLATAGLDDGPAWSPDGRRVVVRSDGPRAAGGTAQPGVWVVDANGRHPRLAVPGRGIAYVDW
jgi:TolB protein